MTTSRRPFSYLARAMLAGAVLYFCLDLSAGDRGPIDHAVIAVVGLAIGWNAVQLSRRMGAFAGRREAWRVQRTLLFWIVGAMNTVGARAEDFGTWRTWLGIALVVAAICDTVALARREREAMRSLVEGSSAGPVEGSTS